MCFSTPLLRHRGHAFDTEDAPDCGSAALLLQICGNARDAAPGGEVRLRSGLETASVEMRERVGDVGAALSYRPAPNGRAAHVLHQSDTYESLVAASFIKHTLAKDPE